MCIAIDLMSGWHNGNEGVVKLYTVVIPPLPLPPSPNQKKKVKKPSLTALSPFYFGSFVKGITVAYSIYCW